MKRRDFLKSMLAAGVAPAAIGSGILMPVREIITPNYDGMRVIINWGDREEIRAVSGFGGDWLNIDTGETFKPEHVTEVIDWGKVVHEWHVNSKGEIVWGLRSA